ncbi:hypothetical protein [Desulfosporosinus lacus]|uniref:hypothetical protein n=1 Tax=Desulfosporosinus lacus TaxID=329936 RepID=UPI0011610A6C|nr:hypothetical protein [Desulfosporosinus lacus]
MSRPQAMDGQVSPEPRTAGGDRGSLVWGRLNGSSLSCLRKDVTLCDTASRVLGRGNVAWRGRHISCAPSDAIVQVGDGS